MDNQLYCPSNKHLVCRPNARCYFMAGCIARRVTLQACNSIRKCSRLDRTDNMTIIRNNDFSQGIAGSAISNGDGGGNGRDLFEYAGNDNAAVYFGNDFGAGPSSLVMKSQGGSVNWLNVPN